MSGSQNKIMIGMFATSTVLALASVIAVNMIPQMAWPLPEGAEIIDPFSGEAVTFDRYPDYTGTSNVHGLMAMSAIGDRSRMGPA